MTNKTVEAVLRLSSKLGSMSAFGKVADKLALVDRKAQAFNRTQAAIGRSQAAVNRSIAAIPVGKLVGAAAVYGGARAAKEAYVSFADVERQLTRTGIKLGATKQQMTETMAEMTQIANKYAVPIDQVREAFDALAESGNTFEGARELLDGMVKATQGMGSAAGNTVSTFDAARKSFGLATKDAEAFFDVVAAGGAMGKFEGSDLARYLPSLMPTAARQGYSGMEGTTRLVAALEVMRDFVGTSEEANTATQDFFDKIASEDVQDNFKEIAKIDLAKQLAKAKKEGKDVVKVMADLIRTATNGDASKLSLLFGDRDSRRFADMLLNHADRVEEAYEKLRGSAKGTIQANVNLVITDAKAKIDELENHYEKFKQLVGSRLSVVISPTLEKINQAMEDDDAYAEGIKRNEKRDGLGEVDAFGRFEQRFKDEKRLGDAREAFIKAMRAIGRGEAGSMAEWFRPKKLPLQGIEAERAEERERRLPPRQVMPDAGPIPLGSRAEAVAANEADAQRAEEERKRRQAIAEAYKHGNGRESVAQAQKNMRQSLPTRDRVLGDFDSAEEQDVFIKEQQERRRRRRALSGDTIVGEGGDDELRGGGRGGGFASADAISEALTRGGDQIEDAGVTWQLTAIMRQFGPS